ncbi:thiol reductant ABC exporter subunit CydD [Cardiobacteriaceae bacterium TAE3-ERU3]|nr:thiol reductant ABC exporter subunit CydD [Cardiobacteriaceae bacterium TAE3-ERU3]
MARDVSVRQALLALTRPHRAKLSLALLIALVAAVVMIVQNALIAYLFATWLSFSVAGGGDYMALLWQILPWLLGCFALRSVLEHWRSDMLLRVSLDVRTGLRERLLTSLEVLGPARRYFGSDGALSSLLLDQVDALDGYISRYYIQKQLVAIVPLMLICATYYYSPLAAILLLLTAPLVPIFMILVGHAAANKNREQLHALARLSGRFLDLVRGMATLQRLQAGEQAQKAIDEAARDYQRRTMSVLKLAFLSTAVLELFASLAIALVAVYLGLGLLGILPWAKGEIPVPFQGALFILLLAPEFYQPLRQLGADYHDKAKAEAAVATLLPLLAQEPQPSGGVVLDSCHAPALCFAQVAVMGDNSRVCLPALDLSLRSGERVVICGESGSGKSTLLQVLLGFRPFSGSVQVNGHELVELQREAWLAQIGYLAQQPPLLAMSIADNLRLAAADADDAVLECALQQVGMADVVARLPQGINTVLGEHGRGLSGGQLQRLAIAQLLLRDAPLWLLDEPTAHLDPQTGADIMALLGRVSIGKTVLLASHDVAEVTWADRVFALEGHSDATS